MSDQVISTTHTEEQWKQIAEDMLIAAYVPNSPKLGRRDALELALQRDAQAAFQLEQDVISAEHLAKAARVATIMIQLGY